MKFLITLFVGLQFIICPNYSVAQARLVANGPGNTYELINNILAPNYTSIEAPDQCSSHPSFGRHIAEVYDSALGKYVFEFYIHVPTGFPVTATTADNDRCINFDRQRVEIKTYESSPDSMKGTVGEILTCIWRFKIPAGFQPSSSFTHIHQIKAVGGDDDLPFFTLTPRKGTPNKMELIYVADSSSGTVKYANVNLSLFENVWVEATEVIKVGNPGTYSIVIKRVSDGVTVMSYTNPGIKTIRPGNTFIRPKWGIYRSLNAPADLRDETLRIADISITDGTPTVTISTANTTFCSNNSVVFTAANNNGGIAPTYQWKNNGTNIDTGATITVSAGVLHNGDVITCVLTVNNPVQTNNIDISNAIKMTVKSSSVSTTNTSICPVELPYHWNGLTFSGAGTQSKTFTGGNAQGCDSTATLVLAVNQPTTSDTTAAVCNTFTWHDSTYKASTDAIWHTTNAAGCDSARTLHLTITSVTSNTTKTNATCYGTATGSFTVNPTYGVSPFTYRIGTTSSYVSSNVFNNLKAGKYTASILDANGCAGITSQVTITQPVAVTGSASSTPATCYGVATGSITVTPSTGVAPFMYRLGTTGTFGSSNVFSNVKGGNYIIYLLDANTCIGNKSVTVLQPTKLSATFTQTPETCPNAKNGSVTVTPSGATPPYTYRFGSTGSFGTNNTFSNLAAGSYRSYVNDANNCSGYSILTTVGRTLTVCPIATRNMAAKTDIAATQQGLAFQLTPNPSDSYFTLRVKAAHNEAIQLRVIDVNGISLFTAKGMAEQAFKFGESFAPGVYMIEVMQGDEVKTVKAIKIRN